MIKVSSAVREVYPDIKFGIMKAYGFQANAGRFEMDILKENEIKRMKRDHKEYSRKGIINMEPLSHYISYFKKFNKTYPVLLQLESILIKDKEIPSAGIPVEAMFLAELNHLLLTAGHDLNSINGDLTIDMAAKPGKYRGISGKEQQLVERDLFLTDETGIMSSILKGPDYRTRIEDLTKDVMFFVYGVEGITEQQIRDHLKKIQSYLLNVIPDLKIRSVEVC